MQWVLQGESAQSVSGVEGVVVVGVRKDFMKELPFTRKGL